MSVPSKYFLVLNRQQYMTLLMGLNEACGVYNYHTVNNSSEADVKYNSNKLKDTKRLIKMVEKCEKEDPTGEGAGRAN